MIMETCKHCGSLLSAVTWTCVRGNHCPGERSDKYRPGDVIGGYSGTSVDHLRARIGHLAELLRQLDEHDLTYH
jgi:hypothetical protein